MADESPRNQRAQIHDAIVALEAQRALLGNAVVNASVRALRRQLAELEPPPSARQRKLITVLFADVSGFTELGEHLDAEELSILMNTLWERLDGVLASFGAYIDKHIGDAVMALWGVRTAHEDDPEIAIRAALAMQEELACFRRGNSYQIEMRIAINTGRVLLGNIGSTAEFTAMGDAVNTADRLQKAAPIGKVLISHDTYQHVRGVFDVTPLEPISLKGKEEALRVYVVRRAKSRSFRTRRRGVEGIETRMIGRALEKEILQQALHEVIAQQDRQVITVSGEAGIGKSRLLYEFENWVDLQQEDILFFRGRARQEYQHIPFGVFSDLFSFRFGIQEDDAPQDVRRKLLGGFAEQLTRADPGASPEAVEMHAHFVGHLLGYDLGDSAVLAAVLDDPKQIRDRAFTYLQNYFRAAGAHEPVLVLIEDLHWADDSSLDMFSEGAELLSGMPLLVVATARPDFFARRPAWMHGRGYHRRLDLDPLTREENSQLVHEIFKLADDVPAALHDLIIESSEGNPYYVEELVKMLIEEGAILPGEDRWRVNARQLAGLHVPPTLAGILQARMDSLPLSEQLALQQAAVIGRVFWEDALAAFNIGSDAPLALAELPAALSRLRQRDLIYLSPQSTFRQTNEYLFAHVILREVAYESVLIAERRHYHGLLADWLRGQTPLPSLELIGLAADHLSKAGRTAEAIADLMHAGQEAAARYANDEAIAYLTRALSLVPSGDRELRHKLLDLREKIISQLGDRARQAADLDQLEPLQ